jgi:hypothetical protein
MIPERMQNPMIQDLMNHLDADQIEPAKRRLESLDIEELIAISIAPENDGVLQAMCTDSYVHANGFYKISFPYSIDSPVRVRLHIWPGDSLIGSEPDAHNHKWSFASKVLTGTLTHDVMKVRPGGGEHYHYEYTRIHGGHRFMRRGKAELQVRSVEASTTGRVYAMDSRTVHRVRPAESAYTATIVVELAPARVTTDVFVADRRKPEGVTVVAQHLGRVQMREILSELLTRIA